MKKIAFTLLALAAGTTQASAIGAKYKVLHAFCTQTNCVDGGQPYGAPVPDGQGNWFGTTTEGGGGNTGGTIYEMRFDGTHWSHLRLHRFCAQANCKDGGGAYAGLVVDTAGNLYGTTTGGGATNGGVAFEMIRSGEDWKYHVIYNFCAQDECADGKAPQYSGLAYQGQASGALYDGVSPLYGTTQTGGIHERGAVFALVRSHGHRVYAKLHDFCNDADCTDGALPYAGITVDATGNTLYGTTFDGGAGNSGTAYKLVRGNEGWTHSVIHDFCPSGQAPCADGSFPQAGLALDAQGNLYGTTENGGDDSFGTVFEISAAGQYRRLHSFCAEMGCPDGSLPYAGVTIDGEGHLWGATNQGGPGFGTLFRLSGPHLTTFKTAATLGVPTGNGGYPNSPPTRDASGALIGVTQFLGDHSGGVFYRLRP